MKIVFCIIQNLNNLDVVYVETVITLIVLIFVQKEIEILIYVKIYPIIDMNVENVKMDIE